VQATITSLRCSPSRTNSSLRREEPCRDHPLDQGKSNHRAGRSPGSRVKARCTAFPDSGQAPRVQWLLFREELCASRSPFTVAGTAADWRETLPPHSHSSLFQSTGAISRPGDVPTRERCAIPQKSGRAHRVCLGAWPQLRIVPACRHSGASLLPHLPIPKHIGLKHDHETARRSSRRADRRQGEEHAWIDVFSSPPPAQPAWRRSISWTATE